MDAGGNISAIPDLGLEQSRRKRRIALFAIFGLIAGLVLLSVALLVFRGNDIHYSERETYRVWSGRGDAVDASPTPASPGIGSQRVLWYTVLDRTARKTLLGRTRNNYTLRAVLVMLPPAEGLQRSGTGKSSRDVWDIPFELKGQNSTLALTSRVLRDRIEVAGQQFDTRKGMLVVIDGQGKTSQHRFESGAQRESEFEVDLLSFLRAQKLLPAAQ